MMHFSFVRLTAATRISLQAVAKLDAPTLPSILLNRHYISIRPLVLAYMRTQEDGERIRALSSLTSVVRNVKDPIAIDGIHEVLRMLGSSDEDIEVLLKERESNKGTETQDDDDETLWDSVEFNLGGLRRIKAVYSGKNNAAEFETLKAKSIRHIDGLTELVDQLSVNDFDRLIHGVLRVYSKAIEFSGMDRFTIAVKQRLLAIGDEAHGHTVSRTLYLLLEVSDKDEEFRNEIAPQVTRTLSTWNFRETVLAFHSFIISQRFDDPTLFGAMLDHTRIKTQTATAPQILYLVKLMRKNEIRHTPLLNAVSDRLRLILQSFTLDEMLDCVDGLLELAHDTGELMAIILDHFSALVSKRFVPWFHVSRIALLLERVDETVPGRAELSIALGRYILKYVRSVREETMDIVRSLCWEYRKM